MSKYFEYICLESGIHYFTWFDRSQAGSDEYYSFILKLYASLPEDVKVVRILHDYQYISTFPFPKVLNFTKLLQISYPNLQRRIAYISDDSITQALIDSLVIMSSRSGKRQFFRAHEEQQAIDWLLTD